VDTSGKDLVDHAKPPRGFAAFKNQRNNAAKIWETGRCVGAGTLKFGKLFLTPKGT
jgi:hypothetical protein